MNPVLVLTPSGIYTISLENRKTSARSFRGLFHILDDAGWFLVSLRRCGAIPLRAAGVTEYESGGPTAPAGASAPGMERRLVA